MKHSKFKAYSLMGGVPRKLVTLSLTLIMVLAMSITSFADVEITKDWNDDLTGGSAKGRSVPTVTLTGETSYEKLLNMFYPVGCYFETEDDSFDPNTAWGGTWIKETVTGDTVIEEGQSGIWTYRKWKSGVAECWGIKTGNTATFIAWSGGAYRSSFGSTSYPSGLFISTPVNTFRVSTTSGAIMASGNAHPDYGGGNPSATSSGGVSLYAFDSAAYNNKSFNTTGYMYAIGFWKSYTAPTNKYIWKRTA